MIGDYLVRFRERFGGDLQAGNDLLKVAKMHENTKTTNFAFNKK